VSSPSSHRNISRGKRYAVSPSASGGAAPIITARRWLRIRYIVKDAWIVLKNGALATRTTDDGIANNTPPPSSGTANFSTFETKNGTCAIS